MKLRNRLFLFGTTQLVVFGGLFLLAYLAFDRSVLPAFRELLDTKCERVVGMMSQELDLPLGADDPKMVEKSLEKVAGDPDLVYIAVRDARGRTVYEAGSRPESDVFAGDPDIAHDDDDGLRAWRPVSLEGVPLGSVAIMYGTSRVDAFEVWGRRLAIAVLLTWLAALAYSIVFSRGFVSPIRAMMDFSRTVADGSFSQRIAIAAPGELSDLRDNLNQMTADLEHRESERKAAAQRAEEMQRELLSVSRMAGMAEVATGVLHNVGNVLNSLNVSVSMIDDQVRNSKVEALAKSVQLYDAFPGGLQAFLDTDKGRVLPGYLTSLSKRLASDNEKLLGEIGSVTRNIEHIKSIVAMQQSYARPNGVLEQLSLASLIDDALRMGEASFTKHGIEVVREYGDADTSVLTTDRHKLLQILINLISNARHALKDSPSPPHRLTVRVERGATSMKIAISDTGVGIPSENLAKIFQHGFTTKKGGHGFGLHASANAARELGGTLVAESKGAGCGATFTLTLPTPAEAHAQHN